ncbi:MAG: glycosyltransferase [Chthoniobacteraceae bacterium]
MSLRVAICITTHNRRAELERTLAQITALSPQPDELLIIADGCNDGTADFVRERSPHARLIIHEQGRGSIPSRNEMAAATTCEIFLSLDDDSYPLEPDAIARIRELFEMNGRLAVAAFPQRTDEFPDTLTARDFGGAKFVGTYANSSAAIRASVFKSLGGYPDSFFHMYEEPDFALRCVCAGWQVRYEPCVTVRHHFSQRERNEIRRHQQNARNELWSVLLRCPMPQLLAVAPFRAWRQFFHACKRGWPWVWREPRWWWQCLCGLSRCLRARRALRWPRYRAWMGLVRSPLFSEEEWIGKFGEAAPH